MLNHEQEQAVMSDAQNIVCIAGAGTGKTSTLVARLHRLVSDGVRPDSILVLTFTNAAAAEMKARYMKNNATGFTPTFGTFHAFCYSLLATDAAVREAMGFSACPEVPTPQEVKLCEEEAKQRSGTKLSVKALSGDRDDIPMSMRMSYDVYHKTLTKIYREKNLITFGEMCKGVSKLFINNSPVVDRYKEQYRYICVDEMQDTDKVQWSFVESFKGAHLFCVGDAKQNLYSFRGTTSELIKSLTKRPDWETVKLFRNYRSTEEICEYANVIHSSWGDSPYNLAIHSESHDENSVVVNPLLEASQVTPLQLLDMCKDAESETTAFLVRSNKEVATLIEKFKAAGIKYTTKNSEDSRVLLIQALQDPEFFKAWLPSFLSAEDYAKYIKLKAIDSKNESAESILQHFGNTNATLSSAYSYYQTFSAVLDTKASIFEKYEFIARKLNIVFNLTDVPETEDKILPTILDKLNSTEAPAESKGVYIGTIHSVKGLEYDVVYLLGVGGASFPLMNEDMDNLYYVGCTRAKKRLYIYTNEHFDEEEDGDECE